MRLRFFFARRQRRRHSPYSACAPYGLYAGYVLGLAPLRAYAVDYAIAPQGGNTLRSYGYSALFRCAPYGLKHALFRCAPYGLYAGYVLGLAPLRAYAVDYAIAPQGGNTLRKLL